MSSSHPPTYPVNLRLDTMPVLVVGGGKVALRKVRGLIEAGAAVTVIAPQVEPELKELAAEGRITLFQRGYASGEGTQYRVVFSATGVSQVDWQVSYEAASVGTFVNVADVPERCTFFLPAVVRRGALNLSVTTDGKAPFLARRLRRRLQGQFGEGYGPWLECAGDFRQAVLAEVDDPDRREELFERFFAETLPGSGEPVLPDEGTWRSWIGDSAGAAGAAGTPGTPGAEEAEV